MGKRQVRIFRKDLPARREELAGREVQVILADNRVFRGTVNEFSDVSLCIKDSRQNQHRFRPEEIQELVYDLETLR